MPGWEGGVLVWVGGWIDRSMKRRVGGECLMEGGSEIGMAGCMDGWMHACMDEWMHGWMDACMHQ